MKGFKIFGGIFAASAVASVRLGLFGKTQIQAPIEYFDSSHWWTVFGDILEIQDKDEKVIERHYSIFPMVLAPPEGYEFAKTPAIVKLQN